MSVRENLKNLLLDYARQCQPTTSFHDHIRSSANAPSMPVQSRGIHFQYTSEKRRIFIVLKDFSDLKTHTASLAYNVY